MGGTKRKIEIKKIENKSSLEVTFSKRRKGLYSKVSELCLLSGAKMAILATPVSSKSNFSFYSFGHSSVDSVVSAFLANQPPREEEEDKSIAHNKGLGFWWEDESLAKSDDPVKLRDAIDSISKTLNNLKQLRSEAVENRRERKKLKKQKKDVNETLTLPLTSSASLCIQGDSPVNFEGFVENSEEKNQILVTSCDNIINNNELHGTYKDVTKTLNLPLISSASLCIQGDSSAKFEGFVKNNEDKVQFLATSSYNIIINNNNNDLHGNFDGCSHQELDLDEFQTNSESLHEMKLEVDDVSVVTKNQENLCSNYHEDVEVGGPLEMSHRDLDGEEEFDLDQLIDFEMNSENLWMDLDMDDVPNQNMCSDSEDGVAMVREYLDLDNLQFSDYFNDSPPITAL